MLSAIADQIPKPIKTSVNTVFDLLQRSNSAVAGTANAALKGEDLSDAAWGGLSGKTQTSFSDVLGTAGMEPGWLKSGLGFALDVGLDPLTYVPGGAIVKGLKGAAKLAGAEKALSAAGAAVKLTPLVASARRAFIPFADAPEPIRTALRLGKNKETAAQHLVAEAVGKRHLGLTPEQQKAVSFGLDTGTASPDAIIANASAAQKAAFDDLWAREVAAGVADPAKKREAYVSYIFDHPETQAALKPKHFPLAPRDPFTKERTLTSLDDAAAAGAKTEIVPIAAIREAAGEKAIVRANLLKELTTNPEYAAFVKPAAQAGPGWRKLSGLDSAQPLTKELSEFAFDPGTADAIQRYLTIAEAPGEFAKLFDSITQKWKNLTTVVRPSFHARNMTSNVANMYLAGMNPLTMPGRLAESTNWNKLVAKGGTIKAKGGTVHDVAKLDAAMKQMGIVGTEFGVMGDVAQTAQEIAGRANQSGLRKAARLANPVTWGKASGTAVEDVSRRALFLDRVRKGDSLDQAAMIVKEALFDYSELTPTEQRLRRVIPFFTFARKNLPFQIKKLIDEPGRYAGFAKAETALENATEDQGLAVPEDDRPKYLNDLGAIQLPVAGDGGEATFANFGMPYMDLNRIPADLSTPSVLQSLRRNASDVHPLPKGILEWIANYNTFRDKPIWRNSPDEAVPVPAWIGSLAQQFPDLANQIGLSQSKLWNKPVLAPAAIAHTLNTAVPAGIAQFGKAVVAGTGSGDEAGGSLAGIPQSWINYISPASVALQDPKRLAADKAQKAKADEELKLRIIRRFLQTGPVQKPNPQ